MKVRVNKKFVDAETKKLHQVGEEFEVTAERLKAIQKVSKELVTAIDKKKTTDTE